MKKPKAPRLVTIAIFTTITLIFWVFFSLYSIFTSKPPAEVDPKLLVPLDPTLDTNALTQLRGRVFFEEGSYTPPTFVTQISVAENESEEVVEEVAQEPSLEEFPEEIEVATESEEETVSAE